MLLRAALGITTMMCAAFISRRRVAHGFFILSRAAASSTATLTGRLYRYTGPSFPAPLQAFESPAAHAHKNYCIYLGGLTDGLLACAYVEALGHAIDKQGWALVQPVITSSYAGFGCSSLAKDAQELAQLIRHITEREGGAASDASFAIVGHSTGCQDAVTLLKDAPADVRCRVRAAVLQAPVSDRESQEIEPDLDGTRERLLKEAAAKIAAGDGDALLSGKYYDFVPMSASRYMSLVGRDGPDDLFSSDFSDAQLKAKLGHMGSAGQRATAPTHPGLRTLFCFSGGDEYVPPSVDVEKLSKRFVAAAGGVEGGAASVIIPSASHNLAQPPEAADEFIAAVCRTLKEAVP